MISDLWYNINCRDEWSTGRFAFQKPSPQRNTLLWAKRPLLGGLTSRHSSRQRRQPSKGRFVMTKQIYTCGHCGKEFRDYPSNRTKSKSGLLFCSKKCRGAYQTAKAIEQAPVKTESTCISCREEKPVSEFYRDKRCRANGGIQYKCKECVKTERTAYYDANTQVVNERVREYQRQNPGRHGKGQSDKKRGVAQRLLNYAVEKGRVQKPDTCQNCGKVGYLHAHHWHGYDSPLDVIWLCPSCHHFAHGRGPKARHFSLKEN